MDVYQVLDCVKTELQYHFQIDERRSNDKYTLIRANLPSGDEASAFVSEVEKITSSKFRKFCCRTKPVRIVYHKKWVCQHSCYGKVENSKRDAKCKAFIDICIKRITRCTKRADPYLKLPTPLQGVIKLNLNHSHSSSNPDFLRMLSVRPEVKKQFDEYFNDGMRAAEARRLHESKVLVNAGHKLLANASCNPTPRQVYGLFNSWKCQTGDQSIEPFKRLLQKLDIYESEGVTVKYNRMHPWSILVVTPIMKTAQSLLSSQEVIFVTSTRDCDDMMYTVTMFLTITKAGAIPIVVMLHQNQTTESYQSAFSLLTDTFPLCFGGKAGPDIFITDDLSSEKTALKIVWESSQQFLSHFHVGHAEWRWLMSTDSNVDMDNCRDLMKRFEAVMYAENELQLLEARENILILSDNFPTFAARFEKFFERKEEWVLLYRLSYISEITLFKFCETTIRILIDAILNRTKLLKIIALIEFFISVLDVYLSNKLLDYACNEVSGCDILYYMLSSKMTETSITEIQEIDKHMYLVPSDTKKHLRYIVETDLSYCTCPFSKTGAFCMHQCFLMEHSKLNLPDAPILSCADKQLLEMLALGDKYLEDNAPFDIEIKEENDSDSQSSGHYNESDAPILSCTDKQLLEMLALGDKYLEDNAPLDIEIKDENDSDSQSSGHYNESDEIQRELDCTEDSESSSDVELATEEDKSNFLQEINRLLKFDIESPELRKFTMVLANIKNSNRLNGILSFINSSIFELQKKRI